MVHIHSMATLFMLTLAACGRATPPMVPAIYTPQPTLAPAPTNTPDICAGATGPGVRQRFTLEQIASCLNTVPKVSAFMANNVK